MTTLDISQSSLAQAFAAAARANEALDEIRKFSPVGNIVQALLGWAYAGNFGQLVSGTRDANGVLLSASIVWPDGTPGTYVTDAQDPASGAINAWHATYAGPPAKTLTQLAVTRDVNGAVTAQPAITIV
jgi:hypothetical protein